MCPLHRIFPDAFVEVHYFTGDAMQSIRHISVSLAILACWTSTADAKLFQKQFDCIARPEIGLHTRALIYFEAGKATGIVLPGTHFGKLGLYFYTGDKSYFAPLPQKIADDGRKLPNLAKALDIDIPKREAELLADKAAAEKKGHGLLQSIDAKLDELMGERMTLSQQRVEIKTIYPLMLRPRNSSKALTAIIILGKDGKLKLSLSEFKIAPSDMLYFTFTDEVSDKISTEELNASIVESIKNAKTSFENAPKIARLGALRNSLRKCALIESDDVRVAVRDTLKDLRSQ